MLAAFERWSDQGRYGWCAFPPRNFRLETRVDPDRSDEYHVAIGQPRDYDDWADKHRAYDLRRIAVVHAIPRRVLRARERADWPSPFRSSHTSVHLSHDVRLVHVTSAYSLSASTAGTTSADVVDAIADRDDLFLESILEAWWRRGGRTIYAAFESDILDVVAAARGRDPSWANSARDRLGLAHLDPLRDPIDVVLLAYRVKEVPRAEGMRDRRPLAAPVAIDGGLNAAFCPMPGLRTPGRCVDLAARLEAPVREVIHPRPLLRPEHIVASGRITSPVTDLPDARWAHLEWIRAEAGAADYGSDTDGDLAA